MNLDTTALSYGLVGVLAGISVPLWRAKSELEQKCDFLSDMGKDLSYAFDTVDAVLEDKNTPKPIRSAIIALLAAHVDAKRGRAMADMFMTIARKSEERAAKGTDPISQSMSVLSRHNPSLARMTHHVLASLSFGLVFLHLADSFKVEKVRDEAAKDPVSLWARISRLFGANNDHDPHSDGKLLHA